MRFEISHFTEYHYDSPVHLTPHLFRFRPREDGTQRLQLYHLHVEPAPSRISTQVEPDGNTALVAIFDKPVERLRIHSRANVETRRANPFDFVITSPETAELPAKYPDRLRPVLGPALSGQEGEGVAKFVQELIEASGRDTLGFLNLLNRRLFESFRVVVRLNGAPMSAEECLDRKEGACRDLAVVFMEACRHVGLAARFVSGYQMMEPNQEENHMHAWAETYLPGGGWRGFDPTHGIAVDEHYVPVAASPIPQLATPVEGSYSPISVPSKLKVSLDVRSSCPINTTGERHPGESTVAP